MGSPTTTTTTTNQTMPLTAEYTSTANAPFTITHTLQAPPSGTANPTVPDKTKYLSDLRRAAATMQEQINKELTQRMDEDKAKVAAESGKPAIDEAKEEENYGEEVQEGED